jgi:hypothetical protein
MPKKIDEREIVLFLGAGFSASAELPLMKNFGVDAGIENFNILKHAQADRNSGDFRFAAPMLVDSAFVFKKFQDICKRSTTLSGDEINNLETIFCIAEILKETGQEIVNLDGNPYSVDMLFKEIQLWLWKIYQQYPFINNKKKIAKKNEPLYDKFFQLIGKSNIANNLTVITTNYDLIFEFKAFKNDMLCSYRIKSSKPINAGHGFKEYIATNDTQKKKSPIICKLHGSINFFQNHSIHDEGYLYIANDLGSNEPIGRSFGFDNKPAIFAVDAIWSIQKKYGETFFPAIIPPTYSKLHHHKWLKEIWNNAFEALKNADAIVFIGYSFPESDGFMKALIHGAMAFRFKRDPLKVYVVDHDPDIHKRYQIIFKTFYQKIKPQSFLDAIDNGTFEKIFANKSIHRTAKAAGDA